MVNPALGCYGVYKKNIKSSQHACTVSPTCKTIPDQQQRVQSSQFNSPPKENTHDSTSPAFHQKAHEHRIIFRCAFLLRITHLLMAGSAHLRSHLCRIDPTLLVVDTSLCPPPSSFAPPQHFKLLRVSKHENVFKHGKGARKALGCVEFRGTKPPFGLRVTPNPQ